MTRFLKSLALIAFAGVSAFAQVNTLSETTTSTAVLATDSVLNVGSTSAMNAYSLSAGVPASELYVIAPGQSRGEVMTVASIVSSTQVKVNRRGQAGVRQPVPAGSVVLVGNPNWFYDYDPSGSCTSGTVFVSPWVDTKNGFQWICSSVTGTWVPGFNNPNGDAFAPTAAVASASTITPSGPLFHVTGTTAITGITLPVGFVSGSITIIPDGTFTTTTATNIALGSTAVVSKPLTLTYDPATAKFYPSY